MTDKKDTPNLNIPNILSILRIGMIPVAVWGIVKEEYLFVLVVLVLAGITDALDGFLARTLNQSTRVGKILDPIADKFLFITLFSLMGFGLTLFPIWFVLIVLVRDALILIGYAHLKKQKKTLELLPRFSGKAHTAILFFFLFFVLLSLSYEVPIPLRLLMGLVTATSILSFLDYLIVWVRKRK